MGWIIFQISSCTIDTKFSCLNFLNKIQQISLMSTRNSHHTPLTYLFSCKHSGTYSLNFPPSQCWLGYSNDGVSSLTSFFGLLSFQARLTKNFWGWLQLSRLKQSSTHNAVFSSPKIGVKGPSVFLEFYLEPIKLKENTIFIN